MEKMVQNNDELLQTKKLNKKGLKVWQSTHLK